MNKNLTYVNTSTISTLIICYLGCRGQVAVDVIDLLFEALVEHFVGLVEY